MKTIEQIITEKFEEKIINGDFEKIINEKLESLISQSLDHLTGWGSDVEEQLKARLKPVLETAIADSNLDNIRDKMTLLLNNVLANSELKECSKLNKEIEDYLGYKTNQRYGEKIKLSDIFNKYVEFAKKECEKLNFDQDDLEFDGSSATVYFTAYLEEKTDDEEKRGYFSRYKDTRFILRVIPDDYDEDSSHDMPELDIEFKIDKYGDLYLLEDISINRLSSYPSFIWFLIRLTQTTYKIDIDKRELSEEFLVEVEREY